jgi:hypothetical protein
LGFLGFVISVPLPAAEALDGIQALMTRVP